MISSSLICYSGPTKDEADRHFLDTHSEEKQTQWSEANNGTDCQFTY
jgi:hypothetical protein